MGAAVVDIQLGPRDDIHMIPTCYDIRVTIRASPRDQRSKHWAAGLLTV